MTRARLTRRLSRFWREWLRSILLIEGRVKTSIERGDQYRRGEQVKVWVRRGRITGRPRFLDLARPGETEDWEEIEIPPPGA